MDPIIKSHLETAVTHCGSATNLGKAIGRYQQYVSWLLNGAKEVPGKVAIDIEAATGGAVSRSDLCPHLWPKAVIEPGQGSGAKPSEQAA